jgi:hypothetical protein
MNKIRLFLPVLIIMFFISTACNSSDTNTNTTASDTATTVDTTLNSDTISVDPENFSDPH